MMSFDRHPGGDAGPGIAGAPAAPVRWHDPPDEPEPPWPTGPTFWGLHASYWVTVYLVNVLLVAVFVPQLEDPPPLIVAEAALGFMATACLPVVTTYGSKGRRLGRATVAWGIGAALAATLAVTTALVAMTMALTGRTVVLLEWIARGLIIFIEIGNWCAVYYGVRLLVERDAASRAALEARVLALRSELHHLQSRISPHFLFNTLNTLSACRHDPEKVESLVQSIATYLRFLLEPTPPLVPLARELDALEEYLSIQTIRFGDGLATSMEIDVAAREIPVPPLMVQALVENAIKYGLRTAAPPVRVVVRAGVESGRLVIDVANSGRWIPAEPSRAPGLGLTTLQRRLRLLVGPEARVTHREEEGMVHVSLHLPQAVPPPRLVGELAR